jgi:hypothetical protein
MKISINIRKECGGFAAVSGQDQGAANVDLDNNGEGTVGCWTRGRVEVNKEEGIRGRKILVSLGLVCNGCRVAQPFVATVDGEVIKR